LALTPGTRLGVHDIIKDEAGTGETVTSTSEKRREANR